MSSFLSSDLETLRKKSQYRTLHTVTQLSQMHFTLDGQRLLNFSSNNYLGLAQHPEVIAAACRATEIWGAGAGASRLIGGTLVPHDRLEATIAQWKGTEAALLFNSGYHANLGTIPVLASEGDAILSDTLNHASLIDGCRLSKAERHVFAHNDLNALESLLQSTRSARRRLIITEAIFSMDGDRAPLADMLALAERYDAWVYLDEAHSTGVLGKSGAGLAEELTITDSKQQRLIQMGTLGKALGSFGAYIAGSQVLKETLINRSRLFIFTTALPPACAAAAQKAIEIVQQSPEIRHRLWENIELFHHLFPQNPPYPPLLKGEVKLFPPLAKGGQGGFDSPPSAIIPIILGPEEQALAASQTLKDKGFFVQAIRPPTVAPGTSRLRITISAGHTQENIENFTTVLKEIKKGPPIQNASEGLKGGSVTPCRVTRVID